VRGTLKVRLHAQAALLDRSKPALVKAGNIAAQHHGPTAQLIEKLTNGSAAWMLPVMFTAAPFVATSLTLWKTPAAELADVAEQNEQKFREVVGAAAVQMAAAEAQEAA
jgi:hypothetical protein